MSGTAVASPKAPSKMNMWTVMSLVIFLCYLVFLIYPIVMVLGNALFVDGQLSLQNFSTFFTNPYYSQTLLNSFAVSAVGVLADTMAPTQV